MSGLVKDCYPNDHDGRTDHKSASTRIPGASPLYKQPNQTYNIDRRPEGVCRNLRHHCIEYAIGQAVIYRVQRPCVKPLQGIKNLIHGNQVTSYAATKKQL
jgi:hypothetical protein